MNEKYNNLIMFYHTTLRNVGLFTSISFASLGYSRFHRDKSQLYNIALIIISLCFLYIATIINYYLILDINDFSKHQDDKMHEKIIKWNTIPKIIISFQAILFLLGIYTLIKQLLK